MFNPPICITVTSNTILNMQNQLVLCDSGSNNITIFLPDVIQCFNNQTLSQSFHVYIKKISGNNSVIIQSVISGITIDGSASITLTGNKDSVLIKWDGYQWYVLADAYIIAPGTVTSVSGTINRITTSGTSNVTVDIASGYVGQNTITTLGTITTGTWNASTIPILYGGTGNTTYTNGQLLIGNSSGNTLTKATLTAGGGVSILNGNGSITISASGTGGTVTSIAASGSTGISISGSPITTSGTIVITNTLPDQTIVLNNGTGISVTGTYPNFTITNSSPSSGGTVTNFTSGNLSPLFTTSVATSTTTPALTFAQVSQNQNLVFASPSGASGVPLFRTLVSGDIPALAYVTSVAASGSTGISISGSPITSSGTITITNTGVTSLIAGTGINLSASTGNVTISASGGTVTNFSAGDLNPLFTSSVATSNSTPSLSFAQVSQSANLGFLSPSGSTGVPTFRKITGDDITNSTIDLTTKVSGILPIVNGGTGVNSFGGWVLLSTQSASSSATIDFIGLSASYSSYKIVFYDVLFGTTNAGLWIRVGTGVGPTYQAGNSDYAHGRAILTLTGTGTTATNSASGDGDDNQIVIFGTTGSTTNSTNGEFLVYNPSQGSNFHHLTGTFILRDNAATPNTAIGTFGGTYKANTAVTAIRIMASTGNLASGGFKLYGII